MGGWDFIRKWGANGSAFVDQLDRDGWVRQECRTPQLTCNPDRTIHMEMRCLMHRGNGVTLPGVYRRCDVSQTPAAMHWTAEVGRTGEPWQQVAQGFPLASAPNYRVAVGGVFLAPDDRTTSVRIAYALNTLKAAGHGKRLMIESIQSDDPGACKPVSAYKIFQERALRAREEPVAWSVSTCTVTEYVRAAKLP